MASSRDCGAVHRGNIEEQCMLIYEAKHLLTDHTHPRSSQAARTLNGQREGSTRRRAYALYIVSLVFPTFDAYVFGKPPYRHSASAFQYFTPNVDVTCGA